MDVRSDGVRVTKAQLHELCAQVPDNAVVTLRPTAVENTPALIADVVYEDDGPKHEEIRKKYLVIGDSVTAIG